MISELVDHLWQSTLFVGVAWLLTLALKKNRAQVRYWVWFTASVKFLAPLALLIAVGELAPRHAAGPMVRTEWVAVAQQIGELSIALPVVSGTADRARRDYLAPVVLAVWVCGFLGVAICWLARWRRISALRKLATPVHGMAFAVPVMSAPGLIEPGIFGVFRPLLLLPDGITERLSPAQLDAILVHELCHVRRKDNLTATIHMMVQAIFWFHPLVWWLGVRLVDERERACDEEVLRLGSKPGVYAEGILSVCKLYVESPLACVSGVTGSNLKRRIEAIMKNRILLRLSLTKKAALAAAGIVAVAAPIAIGILHAQPAPTPTWEVVSIRLSPAPLDDAHCVGSGASPGRMTIPCDTLSALIDTAYFLFADGHRKQASPPARFNPVTGGPAWIHTDHWQINAKAEGDASQEMMRGPMLQALLEDRFKLKVHRETREVPVYALTVAKGGPKLSPIKEGSCAPFDSANPAPPPAGQAGCGLQRPEMKGPNFGVDFRGTSLDRLSKFLNSMLDRPVVDKTGITGLFNFHLEFTPDEATPGMARVSPDDPGRGPSIFTAVQEQLGLKLEPAKGPGEFLVVDHVERPSEN